MRPFVFRYVNSALQLRCHMTVKYLNFCLRSVQNLVRKIKGYVTADRHNSGAPGAISTKLGKHMTICMYKNLVYILFLICVYEWVFVRLSDRRLG
jgi:hypothetical protein